MRNWLVAAIFTAALVSACANDQMAGLVQPSAVDVAEGKVGDAKVAALLRVAVEMEEARDFQNAAGLYRSAHNLSTQLDLDDPAPLTGLGRTLAMLGNHDEAMESFRAALELRPDDPDTRRLMGNSLVVLGLAKAAKTQFAAAMETRRDARAYNSMGVANDMAGDHDAAQVQYRTGLKLEPGNLTLRNNLGLSLAFAGKFDEAIEILRRTAANPRAGARHRNNLALAYGLAGRTEEAARISRIYLGGEATGANISYYKTLRALNDTRGTVNAIGAHIQASATALFDSLPLDLADQLRDQSGPNPSEALASSAPVAPGRLETPPSVPPNSQRAPAGGATTRHRAPEPVATGPPVPLIDTQVSSLNATPKKLAGDMPVTGKNRKHKPPRPAAKPKGTIRGGEQYVVQFATYLTPQRAQTGWKQIFRTASELLKEIQPDVQKVNLEPGSAPLYRLRSQPLHDKAQARSLCMSLKIRRIDCLVYNQLGLRRRSPGVGDTATMPGGAGNVFLEYRAVVIYTATEGGPELREIFGQFGSLQECLVHAQARMQAMIQRKELYGGEPFCLYRKDEKAKSKLLRYAEIASNADPTSNKIRNNGTMAFGRGIVCRTGGSINVTNQNIADITGNDAVGGATASCPNNNAAILPLIPGP